MVSVLVTGASSLPGFRTAELLSLRGFKVLAGFHSRKENLNCEPLMLDVRDVNALSKIFERYKPRIVIHAAAYGDVDGCEKDREKAWEVNVIGSINVMKLAAKYSEYVIYISTDYVFDGERGGYSEDDPPNPVNYYGLTKLCGEAVFKSSTIPAAIVRCSSIYGLGPGRMNFAKYIIKELSEGREVKALIDQFTTPTQASLLAEAIAELIEKRLEGVFHIVGERTSRYDFALKIAEALNLPKNLIKGIKIEDMKWYAKRPVDSSLDCRLTRSRLKTDFHTSTKALNILKEEHRKFID